MILMMNLVIAIVEDKTNEIEYEQFKASSFVKFTKKETAISDCNVFVITVPTPIDKNKQPDLSPIVKASEDVAGVLKPGDTVGMNPPFIPGNRRYMRANTRKRLRVGI